MKYCRLLIWASLWGQIIFIAVLISLHFLRPDKNPAINFVSEYAVGNCGWLMTLAFFSNAIGQVCLFGSLLCSVKASRASIITFTVWCVGAFLFSIFKTDIPGEPATFTGLVLHGMAALLSFLFLAISMITWANVFKRNEYWNKVATLSAFFGIISIVLFLVFLFSPTGLKGFTERILIAWNICWQLLIVKQLFRLKISASYNETKNYY